MLDGEDASATRAELARIEQLLTSLRLARALSARERQVVVGGARGLDTKSTAAELGLSPKTVDEVWRRIYRKFNCKSRVEILARLLASALVPSRVETSSPRLNDGNHLRV